MSETTLTDLIGLTMATVQNIDGEELRFTTTDGRVFKLWHPQDCCESVCIEDITGDLDNLVGAPILLADESSSDEWPEDREQDEYPPESFTWTFYRFGTIKGYVDVRWLGTSNGYYSERVDFEEVR